MITNEGDGVSSPVGHAAARHGADASGTRRHKADRDARGQVPNPGDLAEQFLDTVFNAARQTGCELLFEIPSVLFYEPKGRSAAMRRGGRNNGELFFILFNADSGEIRILDEMEAPETVRDFTYSYAGVLGLIAGDRRLRTPLLQ